MLKQKAISFITSLLSSMAFAGQEPPVCQENVSYIPAPEQNKISYENSPYPEVREAFSKYQEGSTCFLHVLDIEAQCLIHHLEQCSNLNNEDCPQQLLHHLESNFLLQLEVVKRIRDLGIENSAKIEDMEAQMYSTLAALKMRFP